MVDDLPLADTGGGRGFGKLVFLAAFILSACALIVASWDWRQEPKPEPLSGSAGRPSSSLESGQERIATYVGEAACRECHPGESALQARSGHARTLRLAERSPVIAWLNGKSVSDPKYPEVTWSYHVRDKKLIVDRTLEGQTESMALDYSLGSGKHGVTFVAIQGGNPGLDPTGIEHHISYFADGPRLAITPGQERRERDWHHNDTVKNGAFGLPFDQRRLQECLACHSTLTSTAQGKRLETATLLPNVSCERCHGPGRDHVAAARKGEAELTMRMGYEQVQPWVEVNLCGECHRLPSTVSFSSIRPENPSMVRFQGVGISMSACYAKGLGSLRCTTCHDPHDRASSDHTHYEAACLSCHRMGIAPKVCSVSPEAKCVSCHMPRREIPGNGTFTDHWIRKPTPKRSDPPKGEAARKSGVASLSPATVPAMR
jgi:hypothetical protein